MTTLSLTDIIGPIMVGPSSSHTAGALRIAYMARRLSLAKPASVEFRLLGSFAHTLQGHGTDKALVAGILGLATDDLRIRDSFEIAREQGLAFAFNPDPNADDFEHPNTIDIRLTDEQNNTIEVRGESIGGGAAVIRRIDGVDVYITGENTSIVTRQRDVRGVLAHIAYTLSEHSINIATTRLYRERRGDIAYTVLETDQLVSKETKCAIEDHPAIYDVRIIPGDTSSASAHQESCPLAEQNRAEALDRALQNFADLDFASGAEFLAYCQDNNLSVSQAFLAREQALLTSQERCDCSKAYLSDVLEVMREAALEPTRTATRSMGGLIGGEALKLRELSKQGKSLCDDQLSAAITYSMAVLETNASMGRIVAAPTAGSAGVVPGVLLALQESRGYSDEELVRGLLAAGAIGYLITRNATVSGAEGGCQAEIGSAAAMAAAAATELAGGTPQQCFDAASNALMNMMGLVCDPVAGLVELPCQKRNAAGAATALISAQIALAGIGNLVDFDQTVEAMYKVGQTLPFELRESALGGIAATPAACAYCAGCKR